MPEGHTIHRLARDHRQWFVGHVVRVASASGRFADGAAQLDGQVLEATDAWGKHLFHRYEDGRSVHVHLGLFGKVFVHRADDEGEDEVVDSPWSPPPPRDTSRYRVIGAGRAIDLIGATACDLWTPEEVDALTARLGPDPIRRDADPERAWAALQRRLVGIGRALMDQAVLAGVGHVYKQDACRRCGTAIRGWDLSGRWAYACETCQPPPRP